MMVVRRTSYPQVEARAGGLMTRALAIVPRRLPVGEAARLAGRRHARLLLARVGAGWGGATPATVARAQELGLANAPLETVLWGVPSVDGAAVEVAVRRRLGPAVPFVVVAEAGQPVGAVLAEPGVGRPLPRSAGDALERLDEAMRSLLRTAGRLGLESGWRVAAVGGLVRDLVRGRPTAGGRDVDLAVEGDARALARRLGAALGGRVREHEPFLTATVTLPEGRHVDLATARRERYRRPGALPVVEPAALEEDLARRDFSINALAIRVDGPAWGELMDPTGGLADLRRGRIRILHPLSFIEDPTRILRAGRFAARFGFDLEPTTRRLLAAAARLEVYGALSGDRVMAELTAILAEDHPAAALTLLGGAGAFRLFLPGYRFSPDAEVRLGRVVACGRRWTLDAATVAGLHLLALSADLVPVDAEAWAARSGASTPLRAAIARARAEAPGLAALLAEAPGPEAAYAVLQATPELSAAWVWVRGSSTRARRYVAEYLTRWRGLAPLLTGEDLEALGLPPGPLFGRLLEGVRAAQAAATVTSREQAIAWVREALSRGPTKSDATNGSDPRAKGG